MISPKPKTELLALINAVISNVCQAENTAAAVCQMLLRASLYEALHCSMKTGRTHLAQDLEMPWVVCVLQLLFLSW